MRLGSYEVIAKLGEGGMGEVYRARDTKLDRDVALKVLPRELAEDKDRLARFEREAKVLASLNHPSISTVHDTGEHEEENLLGAGAPGVKPFFIWSASGPAFAPHVNAGYLWNGASVLAGSVTTGEAADLPDQAFYTVGADIAVNSRLTVALDILGRVFVDAPRLLASEFQSLNGITRFPNVAFAEGSFAEHDGSVGVKLNLAARSSSTSTSSFGWTATACATR